MKTLQELVDIEKYKNYPSWAIHDAIRSKEMNEIQFREWVNYVIGECVRICESGNATQMTSNGAANAIRQRFAY